MTRHNTLLHLGGIAIISIILSGCGGVKPFKAPVSQGVIVEQSMLAELQAGLSKQQVRSLLGPNYGQNPFRPNLWEYTFTTSEVDSHQDAAGHLQLHFDDQGFLERWELLNGKTGQINL